MVQLRHQYQEFCKRGCEIIILSPDTNQELKKYWETEQLPFIGLSDSGSKIASLYYQEVSSFKLGRVPAVFIIDINRIIRFKYYGRTVSDFPDKQVLLAVIDKINANHINGSDKKMK